MSFQTLALLPVLGAALLSSCATMKSVSSATTSGVGKMGEAVGSGFGKLADAATSPFKPGIPVVEARPEDFREVPTGHDQAIAYQRKQDQRRGLWDRLFSGPVDFEEPALPDDTDAVLDAGLLPPKAE